MRERSARDVTAADTPQPKELKVVQTAASQAATKALLLIMTSRPIIPPTRHSWNKILASFQPGIFVLRDTATQ